MDMLEMPFKEFQKLDLRVGRIEEAERVPETDKLVKMSVNIGDETRTLAAGIADVYDVKDLVGKSVIVLVNLEPKTLRGIESKGMILAAVIDGKPVLLTTDSDVEPGAKVM
ncbi:MAG: methionine--tRNA ligase [Candidatus Aenigmatarchaeota archaeon]